MKISQPFHLVSNSPWPLLLSLSLFNFAIGIISLTYNQIIIGLLCLSWILFLWFRDVVRESTLLGFHNSFVKNLHFNGVMWFILSEVLVFFAIFWTFLHSSLAPTVELALNWPPKGIEVIDPFELPLLGTIILLLSGCTITWFHHSLIYAKSLKQINLSLVLTILLAITFLFIQSYEYTNAPFSINDSIYGNCFYLTTGGHGLHVIVGTLWLIVGLTRLVNSSFTNSHHVGIEASIIYWHLVDVVWLMVWLVVYIWGCN